jgi:thioredoxin 1
MLSLIVSALIGGGLGAALGRLGQCSTGSCPLTANWRRGAVYGAFIGLFFSYAAGGALGSYQPPKNIKTIAEADFNAVVTTAKTPVVVDFYAPWCGPCKILGPRLDALAGEFGDRIKFVQVNVDNAPLLAARFNVEGVPMVLFFGKDGHIADAVVGLASIEGLRAKLEALTALAASAVPATKSDNGLPN